MRRYLFLACGLVLTGIVFQNCSVPSETTLDSSDAASLSTTTVTSGVLSLTVPSTGVYTGGATALIASGGSPPYQYSVTAGFGTIDSLGSYNPGSSTGAVTVLVEDSVGSTAVAQFTVASTTGTISYSLIPVYRAYNSSTGDHVFTLNSAEAHMSGYTYEGNPFNVFQSAVVPAALYRCYIAATKDNYISNYADCSGNTYLSFLGYLEKAQTSLVYFPVYRCVQTSGNHMHIETTTSTECTSGGYTVEGILGYTN